MGNPRHWLIAVAVSTVLAGCAHRHACSNSAGPPANLPNIQRTSIEGNLRAIPKADPNSPEPTATYRALPPTECQCLAVEATAGATLHNQEAELAERGRHRLFKSDAGPTLRRDLLVYTSL